MASFNPQVQVQNQPFYSNSRPLDVGSADKSSATTIAGIGNLLQTATTGADATIKSIIDNRVSTGVDALRDTQTGALEQIANVNPNNRVSPNQPDAPSGEAAGSTQQNLIPGATAAPLPAALQQGLQSATNLSNAGGTGKLNATFYTGRLDMLAKDLRSQFPGYRDEIDQKIASMTGGNPANEYMKELLTGINQGLTSNLSEKEKNLSFVRDNSGIPGASQAATNVQNGTWSTPQVTQWAAQYKGIEAKAAVQKAGLDLMQTDQNAKALVATQNLNSLGDDILNHSTVTLNSSILPYTQMGDMITRIQNGQINVSDADGQQIYQSLNAFRANVRQNMYDAAVKNGSVAVLGSEPVYKAIDSKLSPVDAMITQAGNKDYGMAHRSAIAVQNITDQAAMGLMTNSNPVIRAYSQNAGALNKISGPGGGTILLKDAVSDGLPNALKTNVEAQKLAIASQPDPTQVFTLQQAIQNMKKDGIGVPSPTDLNNPAKKAERAAYDGVTNVVTKIGDPAVTDAVKKNIIVGSFGAGNETLIQEFAPDTIAPNGKVTPGNHSVFYKMANQQNTDEAWRLGQTDQNVWNTYKSGVERMHGQLFGQDIRDLNDLAVNPNLKFTYDSDHQVIGYQELHGYKLDPRNLQTLSNINSSLSAMVGVANKEGRDPNAYVRNLLAAQNLSPDSVGGLITRAVDSSAKPQENKDKFNPYAGGGLFNFPTIDKLRGVKTDNPPVEDVKGAANAATISPEWGNPLESSFKSQHLTDIPTPTGGTVSVNRKAADAFKGFLGDLASSGYKINDVQGYNFREKRGGGGISQHAFGNAIDINPNDNPYVGNPLGVSAKMKTNMPDNVSELAAKWGLSWGGDWTHQKDPMHFEYTGKMPARPEPVKLAGTR